VFFVFVLLRNASNVFFVFVLFRNASKVHCVVHDNIYVNVNVETGVRITTRQLTKWE
jgi:hypothetical protein